MYACMYVGRYVCMYGAALVTPLPPHQWVWVYSIVWFFWSPLLPVARGGLPPLWPVVVVGVCMYVCITAYIAKVPGIPKFSTSSLSLRRHLTTGRAQRGPFLTALEFATDVSTKQAVFHIFDPSQYGEILINFAHIQTHVGYQWRHKMLCVPNIKPSVLLRLGIHKFLPIPKYYHIMVDRSSTKEFWEYLYNGNLRESLFPFNWFSQNNQLTYQSNPQTFI